MKSIIKKIFPVFAFLLVMNLVNIPKVLAQRNCDKRETSDDVCPIKIGGVQVFDRCFGNLPFDNKDNPVGDAACNALRNANKLKKYFERSVQSQVNELKDDLSAFMTVVTNDAINEEALKKYREANLLMKQIDDEIKSLLKDPKFGVNGRIKAIQTFFVDQGANLLAIGGIAGSFSEAVGKTLPISVEIVNIGAELSKITLSIASATPEARKQFEILKKATDSIINDFKKVSELNVTEVVSAGTSLVTTVGPFTASCAACAGVIATSLAGIDVGALATASGTAACPESAGIGCIVTAAGGVVTAVGAAVGAIAANPACQGVVTEAGNIGKYLGTISKFVNSVSSLANNIQSNLGRIERSVAAINKLATQLGQDNQQSVKNIGTSINNIADDLEAGLQVLQTKTLKAVGKLGSNMLTQMDGSTKDLKACYEKYSGVAGIVTTDLIKAAGDLIVANLTLVDAGKIFSNIVTQSQQGISAADKYIKDKRRSLDSRANSLSKSVFGVNVGVVDLGKTVSTLTSIAAGKDPVKFLSGKAADAVDLAGDYINLAAESLTEAKKAFLNLSSNKNTCRIKTTVALTKVTNAKKAIDIAKAKQNTKNNTASVILPAANLTLKTIEITPVKKIVRATIKN